MRLTILLAILSMPFVLSACEGEEKYPVSGEDCGPEDPVKSLDASDCNPAPLVSGF